MSENTPIQRLLGSIKVNEETACWEWQKHLVKGYGRLRVDGKSVYAHRFAYLTWNGGIPDDCEIDHLCRNTTCCNPDHLEAVTHGENMLRSPLVGQYVREITHCKHGHEFTDENTYTRPDGWRTCRTCNAAAARRYKRSKDGAE